MYDEYIWRPIPDTFDNHLFALTASTIQIQFNGQPLTIPVGCFIPQLLEQVAIRSQLVVVEVNGSIIPRSQHAKCLIAAGDCVEAVTLVGGG
jgi:sulfur carrier protein